MSAHPPFDEATGSAAGRRSGQVRRHRAAVTRQARQALEVLARECPEHFTSDLATLAHAAASQLAAQLALGNVPHKDVHHVAYATRALYEITRLDAGLPTDYRSSLTASVEDVRQLMDDTRRAVASVTRPTEPADGP